MMIMAIMMMMVIVPVMIAVPPEGVARVLTDVF